MTLLREKDQDGRAAAAENIQLEPRVRYEDDAYTWALQQAELLRAGRFGELDILNLSDEVEDVAGREYDKLESALARILQHLLKWDYQSERRSGSWVLSIEEHRSRVIDQLADHPGPKKCSGARARTRVPQRPARSAARNEVAEVCASGDPSLQLG